MEDAYRAKKANHMIKEALGDEPSETVKRHRLQYFAPEIVPYEDTVEQATHAIDVLSDVTKCIQQGTLHTNYWFRDVFLHVAAQYIGKAIIIVNVLDGYKLGAKKRKSKVELFINCPKPSDKIKGRAIAFLTHAELQSTLEVLGYTAEDVIWVHLSLHRQHYEPIQRKIAEGVWHMS